MIYDLGNGSDGREPRIDANERESDLNRRQRRKRRGKRGMAFFFVNFVCFCENSVPACCVFRLACPSKGGIMVGPCERDASTWDYYSSRLPLVRSSCAPGRSGSRSMGGRS